MKTKMKEYAVEYIYDKPKSIANRIDGNIEKIQYTEILFPLSDEWRNSALIKTIDDHFNGKVTPGVFRSGSESHAYRRLFFD